MNSRYSIYVKTDCDYCKKAVFLLQQSKLPFIVIVVDNNLEFLTEIKQQIGQQTVPIILEHQAQNVKLIGGCDDLEKYLSEKQSATN